MRRHATRWFVLVAIVSVVAVSNCATSSDSTSSSGETTTSERADQGDSTTPPNRYTDLDATLWVQSSAEREAHTRQAYRLARLRLDQGLKNDEWTASLEQKETGDYRDKPPAVVLDVDETVLDNAAYQARLLRDGETFDIETWNAWCREANAPAVPGALSFAKYAAEEGVTVFYVTNRQHAVEEATRENLRTHGFPLAEDRDVILTKGEKKGWDSDKTPRRKKVAKTHRILLLVGDNLGDFVGETEVSAAERTGKVERWKGRWGRQWITLANPMYGDWESTTYGYDHGLSREETLRRKLDALETREPAGR